MGAEEELLGGTVVGANRESRHAVVERVWGIWARIDTRNGSTKMLLCQILLSYGTHSNWLRAIPLRETRLGGLEFERRENQKDKRSAMRTYRSRLFSQALAPWVSCTWACW
jgi:hypothetical protein